MNLESSTINRMSIKYSIMINKQLQYKIFKMASIDQDLRNRLIKDSQNKKLIKKLYTIDGQNLKEAKIILAEYGFPSFSLVCKRASHAFWIIIQHYDIDLNFQKKCLLLMMRLKNKNQVNLKDIAYLTDRVRTAEGKKQKFGIQYFIRNNRLILKSVLNMKNIEKWRKEYGLDTIYQQTKRNNRVYAPMLKTIKKQQNPE